MRSSSLSRIVAVGLLTLLFWAPWPRVIVQGPAFADEYRWHKTGGKYNATWGNVQYSPQRQPWERRRFVQEWVSGSRGGSPTIAHWYRTFIAVGIRFQDASATNWSYRNENKGSDKFNWNCDAASGSGCDFDKFSHTGVWQYSWEASYITVVTTTRIVCKPDPNCTSFSDNRQLRLYSGGWK